ncbi:MAG: GNAT family N-acetyltransferase [Ktedonobacteraceae bacterium]|nr:GNAT family N-acetyltransferase [Ktedonobacteraceae bacterium]
MVEKQAVIKKYGLIDTDLAEIKQLADLCNSTEGLALKLNWNVLRARRTDQLNDFFYYDQGLPVGYLALFSFSRREAEVSGMVHPQYRRRGIFSQLLHAAQAECRQRGFSRLLPIVERISVSGQAFVRHLTATRDHSEYRMDLQEPRIPATFNSQLRFRRARVEDAPALAHITALAFGIPENEVNWYTKNLTEESKSRYYVGTLDDRVIGKIDVALDEYEAFIYGFAVLPEHQHKGYGRQILAHALQEILAAGQRKITLEVETENEQALGLYQSCGFRITTIYDYYSLPLEH